MKNLIKLYICIATLLMTACVKDDIASTGSIIGIIKDNSTYETLQGCQVTLSPGGNTASTGSDGSYSFQDLMPGQYSLEVKKDGYSAEKKEVTVTAGKNSPVDIFLTQITASLQVTPDLLDFGDLETTKEVFISNATKVGTIKYSLKSNAEWIQLSSKEGSVGSNTNRVVVTIDRNSISTGSYRKNIILTYEKGEINVDVKVEQVEKAAPKVSIGDFDNITENSFLVKGIITGTGGLKIANHGHCWSENENPDISSTKSSLGDTQEVGEFTSEANGLSSGKTYYVRAYATNSKGTTYSEQVSITMPIKDLPIVVSKPASGINSKSACLSGIIENDGNSDIQERGFYWGTDTNGFKKKIVNTASYDFTDTLTDLEPNTTYYYKAFATNSIGTSSGSLLSFTTLEKNRIVYVSSTGNNNNDGESWETAKETIFKASFNMTAGQEMWIKKGEYKDAICESEGIKIYGGFNGTETDINQRDLTSQTVIMLKTGDYFKGNDMLIDGIVFDGTKGGSVNSLIKGSKIIVNNCLIKNWNSYSVFDIDGRDDLIMNNSKIVDCDTYIAPNVKMTYRFYDCDINVKVNPYNGKYFFYRSTYLGTYYEEHVINNQ